MDHIVLVLEQCVSTHAFRVHCNLVTGGKVKTYQPEKSRMLLALWYCVFLYLRLCDD